MANADALSAGTDYRLTMPFSHPRSDIGRRQQRREYFSSRASTVSARVAVGVIEGARAISPRADVLALLGLAT